MSRAGAWHPAGTKRRNSRESLIGHDLRRLRQRLQSERLKPARQLGQHPRHFHGHRIDAIALDARGRRVVTAGGALRVFDALSGERIATFEGVPSAWRATLAIDGDTVTTAMDSRGLRSYALDSGEFEEWDGVGSPQRVLAFDARRLACDRDGTLVIVDADARRTLAELVSFDDGLASCVLLDDARVAVVTGYPYPNEHTEDDNHIKVWEIDGGRLRRSIAPGGNSRKEPRHALGRDLVVVAEVSGTEKPRLETWDIARGERVRAIDLPAGSLASGLVSGGRVLDAGDDGALTLWDLERGDRVWRLALGEKVDAMAIDETARCAWLALASGFFARIDLEGREPPVVRRVSPIRRLVFDEQGCWTETEDGATCWSLETGARIDATRGFLPPPMAPALLPPSVQHPGERVTAWAASPRGWLVYGTDDGWVRVVDGQGERELLRGGRGWGADSPVAAIALHPTRSLVVIAHQGKHGVAAFDLDSRRPLAPEGPAIASRCIAFSPDGRWLVAGYDDGVARAWDLAAG